MFCRNWPDALDERKAIYNKFFTNIANISYNNLKQFLIFQDEKGTNLPTVDYNKILEMVIEMHDTNTNNDKHEI